jgi:hypothetical protein
MRGNGISRGMGIAVAAMVTLSASYRIAQAQLLSIEDVENDAKAAQSIANNDADRINRSGCIDEDDRADVVKQINSLSTKLQVEAASIERTAETNNDIQHANSTKEAPLSSPAIVKAHKDAEAAIFRLNQVLFILSQKEDCPPKLHSVGTLRKRPDEEPRIEIGCLDTPTSVQNCSFTGPLVAPPVTFVAKLWGGTDTASSFGTNFHTDDWGGSASLLIPFGSWRWQTDLQGEKTGNYSANGPVGYRSDVVGATHLDYMWPTGTEFGGFSGLQDATPTFSLPDNTNGFVGLEFRQFFSGFMVGAQGGYFNVVSTPGTITDTWFIEGRAKFSLGEVFQIPTLDTAILGGSYGYASGTDAATSMGARSTNWGLGLTYGIPGRPFSVGVSYEHFTNNVTGMGTVWNESMLLVNLTVALPNTDLVHQWMEPTQPIPSFLAAVTNF